MLMALSLSLTSHKLKARTHTTGLTSVSLPVEGIKSRVMSAGFPVKALLSLVQVKQESTERVGGLLTTDLLRQVC